MSQMMCSKGHSLTLKMRSLLLQFHQRDSKKKLKSQYEDVLKYVCEKLYLIVVPILDAQKNLFCPKLCWYNLPGPNYMDIYLACFCTFLSLSCHVIIPAGLMQLPSGHLNHKKIIIFSSTFLVVHVCLV